MVLSRGPFQDGLQHVDQRGPQPGPADGIRRHGRQNPTPSVGNRIGSAAKAAASADRWLTERPPAVHPFRPCLDRRLTDPGGRCCGASPVTSVTGALSGRRALQNPAPGRQAGVGQRDALPPQSIRQHRTGQPLTLCGHGRLDRAGSRKQITQVVRVRCSPRFVCIRAGVRHPGGRPQARPGRRTAVCGGDVVRCPRGGHRPGRSGRTVHEAGQQLDRDQQCERWPSSNHPAGRVRRAYRHVGRHARRCAGRQRRPHQPQPARRPTLRSASRTKDATTSISSTLSGKACARQSYSPCRSAKILMCEYDTAPAITANATTAVPAAARIIRPAGLTGHHRWASPGGVSWSTVPAAGRPR